MILQILISKAIVALAVLLVLFAVGAWFAHEEGNRKG